LSQSAERRSLSDAIARIPKRGVVFVSGGAGYPTALVDELLRQSDRFEHLTLIQEMLGNPTPFLAPEYQDRFSVITWLAAARIGDAYARGVLDLVPMNISDLTSAFRDGWLPTPDAALIQLAPQETEQGWNTGVYAAMVPDAAAVSGVVIAEVNAAMPVVRGGKGAAVARVDLLCDTDHPVVSVPAGRGIKPEEEAIAGHVAELVNHGDTIQIGLGSLADVIMRALQNKRDLGVHSGLLTDGLADLIRSGAVTNLGKSIDRGSSAVGVALGSPDLYRFAGDCPDLIFYPYRYTHDMVNISRQKGFVAINSAIEVDLTGQVNAEWLGKGPIGGTGGQLDFLRGSRQSPGGRSIIALPSKAGIGVSRIVAQLQPGFPVTTARSDVDYVVTEHGVACLRGKSLRQRREALLAVSDPAMRADLARCST